MSPSHFVLLFVDSPAASAAFYADLLDGPPVETSPTFAMFALAPGLMLGLWSRHTAEPRPNASGGGAELAFALASDDEVTARFEGWRERGVAILQEPTRLDFGLTFTAADPDGHRLRVFAPSGA